MRRFVSIVCLLVIGCWSVTPTTAGSGPGSTGGTVVGWGYDRNAQLQFPAGLTNLTDLRVGASHCLGLRANWTVVAWGSNREGQLDVPPDLIKVLAIAAGGSHSLALQSDGRVVSWGNPRSADLAVPSDLSGVKAIVAGYAFSLALRSNGTVRAWGDNGQGITNIPSGLTNVIQIAAGSHHALALTADGRVVAWGLGASEQTNVPGGLSNVVQLSASWANSLAATASGDVVGWGFSVPGVPPRTNWPGLKQVAAGANHNVVLFGESGAMDGWGLEYEGALNFPRTLTNILAVIAGANSTFALLKGPALRTQPRDVTILAGSNLTLTASAEAQNPFSFQWSFQGEPLPGATANTLTRTPVLPEHAGSYAVTVGNMFGTMTSTSANVVVLPAHIVDQTIRQDVYAGRDAHFSVLVESLAPVSYQWYDPQQIAIPGATEESFVLTNARSADEGPYWVVVSNVFGTVVSRAMTLTVGPTWTIDDASVIKVPGMTNLMEFQISLLEPRPETVEVYYSSQQGTALAGIDFDPPSGSLTFQPGETRRSLPVFIPGTATIEPKQFNVTIYSLSSDGVGFLRRVATGTILTEDYVPTVSVVPQALFEGDVPRPVSWEVVLSGPCVRPATTQLTAVDGTARDGTDYLGINQTVVFPVGVTTQRVEITMLGNVVREPWRDFVLRLGPSVNAVNAPDLVQTIRDDDTMELPPGFTASLVASNLSFPSALAFAPDGRLMVCEQGGRVRLIADRQPQPEPVLELATDTFDWAEAGLLGIAFDPGFQTNQYLYVYYTVPAPALRNRVSRFTLDGDQVRPGSEFVVLDLDPIANAIAHNGGGLRFGPDGCLYLGVGDNHFGPNAQSLTNRLGKLLRFNPDGTIPADNPFSNTASGPNRAIWAYGLRNPFSFAFQSATGRLLINDVGLDSWEEINAGRAGANYGWPLAEGPGSSSFDNPIHGYAHGASPADGCAIVGAASDGPAGTATLRFPREFAGNYYFADFCAGWIRRLTTNDVGRDFVKGVGNPVALEIGPDGALYCLSLVNRVTGRIYRIAYAAQARLELKRVGTANAPELELRVGPALAPYVLEAGPDLHRWQPVLTNANPGVEFRYLDAASNGPGLSRRFYRLVQ